MAVNLRLTFPPVKLRLTNVADPTDEALAARMRILLDAALATPDPLAGLEAARDLRALLYEWEGIIARRAVESGSSWEAIGMLLGVSRQAAWTRYRAPKPETTAIREARQRIERARSQV